MLRAIKSGILHAHELCQRLLLGPLLARQWRLGPFAPTSERPVEYAFAMRCLSEVWPERVLDVGPGLTAWPALLAGSGFRTTAIDMGRGYWDRNHFNRHHHVLRDDIVAPTIEGPFDAVTCLSVLEHVREHQRAVRNMFRLLTPGGHLVLTCPYREERYIENVYDLPEAAYGKDYNFICQVFSRAELDGWLGDAGAELVEQEHYRIFTGENWASGVRLRPAERTGPDRPHHLTCLLLRKPG